jgi:hypothetical protein
MQVLPNPVTYTTFKTSATFTAYVTINSSTLTTTSFTWSASLDSGSWASLGTSSGTSGGQIAITFKPGGLQGGNYTGTLHVHSATQGVALPDQDIPVRLEVRYPVYLPLTNR